MSRTRSNRRSRRMLSIGALVLAGLLLHPAAVAGVPAPTMAAVDVKDAPGHPWTWPATGVRRVVEAFRAPAHDYAPGHRGMDVAAPAASEVRAPAGGVVAFRGMVVDRPLLTIDHGNGFVTTLEPVDSVLNAGEAVESGMVIGEVAGGGHAAAGTVHIGVRVDGRYVNPAPLFGDVPRAILLPCCER